MGDIGKQIIEKWGKTDPIECRNIGEEIESRLLLPRIEAIIKEHEGKYRGKYYILLNAKKEGMLGSNNVHFTFLISEKIFPPKEMATLIEVDARSGLYDFVWSIPDEEGIDSILNQWETYDRWLVDCCRRVKAEKAKKKILNK